MKAFTDMMHIYINTHTMTNLSKYNYQNWALEHNRKHIDTFTRTPVRVSKINDVAHAQLIYQMLTLPKTYLYRQSQC